MGASKKKPAMAKPKLGRRLWGESSKYWIHVQHTPFVIALASGNLDIETFRYVVSQELHVLRRYINVLEFVASGADDKDTKALFSVLMEDLLAHDSLFKKWDYDWTQQYTAVTYTDFLLAVASEIADIKKAAAYTLGAMIPHIQLYAFIGKELQLILDNRKSSHPYENWIKYYSSKYFQVSTLVAEDLPTFVAEDLLDKLSVSLSAQDVGNIQQIYFEAMENELAFFSSLPMIQKTVVPLLDEYRPSKHHFMIFSDFDFTCTTCNSSTLLAKISMSRAPKSHQVQSQNQIATMTENELRNTWLLLCGEYNVEKEKLLKKIMSDVYDRWMNDFSLTGEDEKFNFTFVKESLEELSEFEKSFHTKVIECGVLKGLYLEDIECAGHHHILRDGCIDFFLSITDYENICSSIHVLSQCWCNNLIKSVFSSGGLNTIDIHSNELTFEQSISTGEVLRKVECQVDKVELFRDILQKKGSVENEILFFGKIIQKKGRCSDSDGDSDSDGNSDSDSDGDSGSDGDCDSERKNLTIYIGDSIDDLLCLLEADIGIVIDASESLKKLAPRFGISVVRLFDAMVEKQKEIVEEGSSCSWTGQSGTLYAVSSWAEIHAFILGLEL